MSTIKNLRKKAGISQCELAKQIGVSRSTVAMWETGKNVPRAGLLTEIADILHCTVDDLLRGPKEVS